MARRSSISVPCVAFVAVIAACGGEDPPPAGSDSGAGIDADSGSADSSYACTASDTNAADTVGCNGGILGTTAADGAFGGRCTPGDEATPEGTCTGANARCATTDFGGTVGICLVECTPEETFVSESDCPTGSRCFTFEDGSGLCYPDCNSGADCTTGACDDDGSCVPADVEELDGGV
jgi:hypothetical protein